MNVLVELLQSEPVLFLRTSKFFEIKKSYDVAAKWNMSAVDDLTKRMFLLPVSCLFRYVCFNIGNSLKVGHYPLLRLYLS